MTTVYRIKNMDTGRYWASGSWSINTGTLYSTKKLADATLNSNKLKFYQKHESINLKVVEATITDKE